MRIAIISNAAFNAPGGAGQIAGIYAELLKSRGHEIRAWGPHTEFLRLGSMSGLARLRFHLNDLQPDDETVKEILDWKPDVLLTHNLTGCGFGTPKRIKDAGIRWVHFLHDVQLIEPSGQIIEGESMRPLRDIWRMYWSSRRHVSMGEPDAVISPTKWLLEFHQRYDWFKTCKAEVISNPLISGSCHGSRFSTGSAVADREKTFAVSPADAGRIIYVGRLDQDKGIDLLLEAWKKLDIPSKHLVIVGDGSWRERIKAMDDPTIELRGILPNADVRKLFTESSVAVVPSRVWENQPTVILEALCAGCRVVAADVGGVRETLGNAGWIVKPDSVDALVEGMRVAYTSNDDATRQDATQKIVAAHDPDVAADRLEGLLRSNL